MKSVSELTDFYYKILSPTLEKLEEDRKRVKKQIINYGTIYTIIFLLIASLLNEYVFTSNDSSGFLLVVYFVIGAIIYNNLTKDYTIEFKNNVIAPMINELDENLNYSSELHISEKTFINSNMFTQSPDRFSGNDYVHGEVDEVNIQFSDVHAEQRHRDYKGRTRWSTIFQGLFIVAEFNKHFKGKTIVLPDTAQSTFGDLIGGWLQSKNLSRDELVNMDNAEFEEEFVVYSDDQIEARYILSPLLMERLLAFKKKTKHPIYISFIGESIHMAIEYNKDLFEPTIFSSLLDFKVAMEYVQTLHLSIGIINELKLNEKLWSKR